MRFLTCLLTLLPLLAAPVLALDCNDVFQSWSCSGSMGYYDYLDGQPGGMLCGQDFTGWTFHVVEVTLAEPGWFAFQGVSFVSGQGFVETTIMRMDDCAGGICAESATSPTGIAELLSCLDAGTYTYVVATHSQDPMAAMNIGGMCATCEDAADAGYFCDICQAVSTERLPLSDLKARYR